MTSGNVGRAFAVLLAVTAMTAAAIRTSVAIPDTGERTLKLYNIHTKEHLDIAFKRNGKFVPGALKRLNRFARDWRTDKPTKMDKRLFDLLWELHTELGAKKPIHLISGYRSPKTNAMLRKTRGGQARKSRHMRGMALDVHFPDVPVKRLRYSALVRQIGGVGYYPTSAIPFIHVDTGRVRHWPRMPRYELALLFPNGKTKHRPRGGGPITRRDARIAARKHKNLARQVAAFHDLRKSSGKRRTLLASLRPPKPRFVRRGGNQVTGLRPAINQKSRPGTQLASIDPRLILRSKPQIVTRPQLRASLSSNDPLADLLSKNRIDEQRIPSSSRPGFRRSMAEETGNPRNIARPRISTPKIATKKAAPKEASKDRGMLDRARTALKSKIEGLLRLANLAPEKKKPAAVPDYRKPAKSARVTMPVDRPNWSNNWAPAPSFDEEHPDELSYRPFPIAPLLTAAFSAAPMFGEMVHPDQSKIFEWIEPDATQIQLEFRPGLEYAELLWNHQFKGSAVTLPQLIGNRRKGRSVRTASGR